VGTGPGIDTLEKRKNLLPVLGIEPRFFGCPAPAQEATDSSSSDPAAVCVSGVSRPRVQHIVVSAVRCVIMQRRTPLRAVCSHQP
jgi:hypothetical protein